MREAKTRPGLETCDLKLETRLRSANAKRLGDDDLGGRELEGFERRAVNRRRIEAAHALHGGVEFVKDALLDHVGDLGADAAVGLVFLDVDGAVRLGDGFEDGVLVQRADGAEIDDFGADAVLFFEDAGGFEAGDDGFAVGDEARCRCPRVSHRRGRAG
jgi:hypothetical protein